MPLTTTFTFRGMNNVCDPVNVGTPDDSAQLQERVYTQCVDLLNCDIDDDNNALRRMGRTLVEAGNISSSWGDDTGRAYCVKGGQIYSFEGDMLVLVGNSPNLLSTTEFCTVNNVIAFSDNRIIGLIEDGVPYTISAPTETTDLLDLETWVKLTYPAGAEHDASNFEIDAFKIATTAGRCLEFFDGALYLAVDNFVLKTRTFDAEHMDIRYSVVAGFKDTVTMIRAVDDGLFIGTMSTAGIGEVCFLERNNPVYDQIAGFKQHRILPYGVIFGSPAKVEGSKIPALRTDKNAVVWTTPNGVYAGGDGGNVVDLTASQMYIPVDTSAASMIRKVGEAWQYVVSLAGGAVAVNLKSAAHSRFTNYDFTGFFKLSGVEHATSATGVYTLTGDTDAGTLIVTSVLTPVVDSGVKESKRHVDLYLHSRPEGSLVADVYADEQLVAQDLPFTAPPRAGAGVRRYRAKIPRGIPESTNWQFRVRNPDGAMFTHFSLKSTPVVSSRTL